MGVINLPCMSTVYCCIHSIHTSSIQPPSSGLSFCLLGFSKVPVWSISLCPDLSSYFLCAMVSPYFLFIFLFSLVFLSGLSGLSLWSLSLVSLVSLVSLSGLSGLSLALESCIVDADIDKDFGLWCFERVPHCVLLYCIENIHSHYTPPAQAYFQELSNSPPPHTHTLEAGE